MWAADPAALGAWCRDCLGLDADDNGVWRQGHRLRGGRGLVVVVTGDYGGLSYDSAIVLIAIQESSEEPQHVRQ